jgi:endonuclease/exonuclease/phosphatase family metal-dependent hydrolase
MGLPIAISRGHPQKTPLSLHPMIKVASYNIHKGVGTDRLRRPERIVDVLDEIDADVVALQEADHRFGLRAAAIAPEILIARGWQPVELNRRLHSIGWHGNAILVRDHAEILTHAHIELPTLEPRGAILAEVRVHGVRVRIVAMHLDLSGLWRRRQARAIIHALEARRPLPTILMGDLNEWSLHGGCLRDFAHHFRIAPTPPSFHSRRPVARLDRIMADRSLQILSCGVHHSVTARRASDHLPIWARIGFPGLTG